MQTKLQNLLLLKTIHLLVLQADGNKDKPINEDNKPDAKDGGYAPKCKLNGIYAAKYIRDGSDFVLYKFTENIFLQCQGKYNQKFIKSKPFSLTWYGDGRFLLTSDEFFNTSYEIAKEEVIGDEKIITINFSENSHEYRNTITNNLKIIKNHEEILKECNKYIFLLILNLYL